MSGLAEILLTLHFKVAGSDQKLNAACQRLKGLGAQIFEGHATGNLPAQASLVVYSSAVPTENPEIKEAQQRGLPIIRRAEVLAELMRLKYGVGVAGSHGKTTTTSMTATVLEHGGLDPTAIIGGQVKSMSSGGKLGRSQFLVAETDESDRSFLLLRPTIAVVTNIDAEHMNAYASLKDLEESFEQFVSSVPFYGLAVLCIDDPRVRALSQRYQRRQITYGFSADAKLRAENLEFSRARTSFDIVFHGETLARVHLPVPGKHLAQNALAAVAVGLEFGLKPAVIAEALASFSGVKRRLEVIAEIDGVTIISDYGHHPSEIRATLQAVRTGWGSELRKFRVIFQPHRYSRTRDCFAEFLDAFSDCDDLLMTDIYAASEEPIEGITAARLCEAISRPVCRHVAELDAIPEILAHEIQPGDVVLCLGAGSIGAFAERLPALLAQTNPRLSAAV